MKKEQFFRINQAICRLPLNLPVRINQALGSIPGSPTKSSVNTSRQSGQNVTTTKNRSRGRGSYAVIVRGFTHDGEDFSYTACGTRIEAETWAARLGVGAGAMRGRKRLGWSGSRVRQSASADLGSSYAAVLFSDGHRGDRPQPH